MGLNRKIYYNKLFYTPQKCRFFFSTVVFIKKKKKKRKKQTIHDHDSFNLGP